jgi:hypothetical protein
MFDNGLMLQVGGDLRDFPGKAKFMCQQDY